MLYFVLLSLVVALQLLAGHPQIAMISLLTLLAYVLFRAWSLPSGAEERRVTVTWRLQRTAAVLGAILAGGLLAAVQLLPTWELVQVSVRAGGLPMRFLASFSWHPALLATLIVPFVLGNPYPNFSVEWAAYLGVLPLLLALSGLWLRRKRETAFFAALATVSMMLAFGDHTPLFPLLARLPLWNLFRVPARFLLPFTLCVALLAGSGFDAWRERLPPAPMGRREASLTLLIGAVAVVGIRVASLEALLRLRWVLPLLFLALAGSLLIAARQRSLGRASFVILGLVLTLVDLSAYGAVYKKTYNDVMPRDAFYARPAVLQFFPADTANYRTLTHEAIVPDLSVMRPSLYPNTSLLYDIPSANGYFPLTPARHARYLAHLTPQRLNLLNVRYFLIPQLLPVDPQTEAYDLGDPYALDVVGREVALPATRVETLVVTSFTSQSADWPQGETVAEIVLTDPDGREVRLPLRMGIETAEWAYDRADVQEHVAHRRPPVAYAWPARSGFPPVAHLGNAYRAEYRLPAPVTVVKIQVVPHRPAGLIHVEQILLIGPEGAHSLAHLIGRGEHRLVYRDPDVAIYENQDALPRAFVVPRARVVADDATALRLLDDPGFDPRHEVLLAAAQGETVESTAKSETVTGEVHHGDTEDTEVCESLHKNLTVMFSVFSVSSVVFSADSTVASQASHARSAPQERPEVPDETSGEADILSYTSRQVAIRAFAPDGGYLVLLDSYYPGWHAAVDDQPAPIYRADVLFRAVRLPPGEHTVTFAYSPASLRNGAVLSGLTLIALALLSMLLIVRHVGLLRR